MTYGHSIRASARGATGTSATTELSGEFGNWRQLDGDRRLQLVDRLLRAPANDMIDAFPLAL